MNRACGSQGSGGGEVNGKHEGVISRYAGGDPSVLPPFVVRMISRLTYSLSAFVPSVGSTSVSPPSPPNGDTIVFFPGKRSPSPLSCMPPHTASPPDTG